MEKLLATTTAAILAILYFVAVVNATTSAGIDEENPNRPTDYLRSYINSYKWCDCDKQMIGKDLRFCHTYIRGFPAHTNPLDCCRQLDSIKDISCQCDALKTIVDHVEGENKEEVRRRASTIVSLCGKGTPDECLRLDAAALSFAVANATTKCDISTTSAGIDPNRPKTDYLSSDISNQWCDCDEQIKGKDLTLCRRLISGNPYITRIRCCQELRDLIKDISCQCEALSTILEEGQYNEDMVTRASTIVTFCSLGTSADCLRLNAAAALSFAILSDNII